MRALVLQGAHVADSSAADVANSPLLRACRVQRTRARVPPAPLLHLPRRSRRTLSPTTWTGPKI